MTPAPQPIAQIVITLNPGGAALQVNGQPLSKEQIIGVLLDTVKAIATAPPAAAQPGIEIPPAHIAGHLLNPNARPNHATAG